MARRETNIFSLSFLDVMSCGFGAIVLIFLIIPLMVGFAWVGDRWIRRTRLIAISMVLTALIAIISQSAGLRSTCNCG